MFLVLLPVLNPATRATRRRARLDLSALLFCEGPLASDSDREIGSVQDLLTAISASGLAEWSTAHLRVWFRGQPDSSWVLHPGVYRPTFPEHEESGRLRIERLINWPATRRRDPQYRISHPILAPLPHTFAPVAAHTPHP